jgi:hypothetical protein
MDKFGSVTDRMLTDFIQCCNVTNSVVSFSLSRVFLLVLQVWSYNNK